MKLQGRAAQTFVDSEGKTICIPSDKICYFSQAEAERHFLSLHRWSSRSNPRREKRYYFCDSCRLYHFTSQEQRNKYKKVKKSSNVNFEKLDYLGEMVKDLLEEEFSYMGATSDYNNNVAKEIQKAVASAVSNAMASEVSDAMSSAVSAKAVASEVSDHELFDTIKWKVGTIIEEAYMDAVSASRISEIIALKVAKR